MSDMWDYAVKTVADDWKKHGIGAASARARNWQRNVSFDSSKLFEAAKKLKEGAA